MSAAALARSAAEAARREALEAERAEREATRAGLAAQVATARARGEAVNVGDGRGPVRMLSRDGLLWLISRKRLSAEQRGAAEMFRGLYRLVHLGGVGSCISGSVGGPGAGETMTASKLDAIGRLSRIRGEVLRRDEGMIAVLEAVAGRGETIRDLARGDQAVAALLEAELGVALRLIARATK